MHAPTITEPQSAPQAGTSPYAHTPDFPAPPPEPSHDSVTQGPRPQPPISPDPDDAPPPLTPELLDDILEPTNTPVQICKIHAITLAQLAALVESEEFRAAADHIKRITQARETIIHDHARLQQHDLHRAIAHTAYLTATAMDELAAARDTKLAATKARLLETARKANTPKPPKKNPKTNPNPPTPQSPIPNPQSLVPSP